MIFFFEIAFAADRDGSLDVAAAYAMHEWTMTAENETASCTDGYRSDYVAGTWRGLPYDWGGYYTLDQFDAAIADGLGAGSHKWHGSLSCTAGVDCSGYISQVWGSGHHSTSTFHAVASPIPLSDLARADAFNDAGSHITLFAYETARGTPIFYEAAGSAKRVRLNGHSGWSYLDGYQPIRYDEMDESGPSVGTVEAPREIVAFPFEDLRWTAGAASDRIDTYGCDPAVDESGPEVLYHFPVQKGGRLRAIVSDDEDVDVDLHVMTAADGEHCIARDDAEIDVVVEPGQVWIAVDTFVGGDEFPGPFLLNVSFDGVVGEPIPEEEPDVVTVGDDEDGQGRRIPGSKGCATAPGGGVLFLAALLVRRRR